MSEPDAAPASGRPASGSASTPGRAPFLSIAEQKARAIEKAKAAKARKKLRAQQEQQRKKQEALDAEIGRARELSNRRWRDCLDCLESSVPRLKSNPWLVVLEPVFIHNYLDALTETLANLSRHEEDLERVRNILQDVYEAFVDVGRFAKYQPAFYLSDPHTLKRFVRLLDQVAHRGSDKALFPNVLSLLGPTFEREELYDILVESRIVHSLMSFVRTDWLPSPATLALLLAIIEQLSSSALMREKFLEDASFPKLQSMALGLTPGFSKEQQAAAQQALALYPPPQPPERSAEQQQHEADQIAMQQAHMAAASHEAPAEPAE